MLALLAFDPLRAGLILAFAAALAWAIGRVLGGGNSAAHAAATAAAAAAAAKKNTTYTRAEVSRHATKDDLWVVIGRKVYDLTPYVNEHPGGVDAMLKNAGGDATAGFHGPQHPARVFDIIDDFEIGGLAEERGGVCVGRS